MPIPKLIDASDDHIYKSVKSQMALMSNIEDHQMWEDAAEKLWGPYLARPIGEPRLWWPAQPLDRPHRAMSQVHQFPDGKLAVIGHNPFEASPDWFAEVDKTCTRLAVLVPPSLGGMSDGAFFTAQNWDEKRNFLKLLDEAVMTDDWSAEQEEALERIGVDCYEAFAEPYPSNNQEKAQTIFRERFDPISSLLTVSYAEIFSVSAKQAFENRRNFHDKAGDLKDLEKIDYGYRVRFRDAADIHAKAAWLLSGGLPLSQEDRQIETFPNGEFQTSLSLVSPNIPEQRVDQTTNITQDFWCAAFEVAKGVFMTTAEAFGNDASRPEAMIYNRSGPDAPPVKASLLAISHKDNLALFKHEPSGEAIRLSIAEPLPYENATALRFSEQGEIVATDIIPSDLVVAGDQPMMHVAGMMGDHFWGSPVIQNGKLVGVITRNVIEEFNHDGQPRPERLEGLAYLTPIKYAFQTLGSELIEREAEIQPDPADQVVAPADAANEKSQETIPVSQGPSHADRFWGWFTGSHFDESYTKADVKKVIIGGPVVALSAGLGATGVTLTLVNYVGVPLLLAPVAFSLVAVGYAVLDRAIVAEENRVKAAHEIEKIKTENTGILASKSTNILGVVRRHTPTALRVAMAIAGSSVSGAAIIQQIAYPDVEQVLNERYQRDNAALLASANDQKAAYDRRATGLQIHIKDLQEGLKDQKQEVLRLAGATNENNQQFEDRTDRLDTDISQAQEQLRQDEALMKAEENGAEWKGASGVAGRDKKYKAALIRVQEDQKKIADIEKQKNGVNATQAAAQRQYESQTGTRLTQSTVVVQEGQQTQSDLATATAQLEKMQVGRESAFASIDNNMKQDPRYQPRRKGTFVRMSALEEYMDKPENKGITRAYMLSVTAFLMTLELAAVLWAKTRRPTRSEIMQAWRDERKRMKLQSEIAHYQTDAIDNGEAVSAKAADFAERKLRRRQRYEQLTK